jgi:hypothetical protein
MPIHVRTAVLVAALAVATLLSVAPAGASACTSSEVQSAFSSFASAFDRGDSARLNMLFAGPASFVWYSSSPPGRRFSPRAERRDTLVDYFRSRHAAHDRIRIVSFQFNGNSPGYGNFQYRLRRSAADFRGGAWFVITGKGAAICKDTRVRFIVMSVGAASKG